MAGKKDRREAMVDYQVAARGVRDPHVLNAMREVPRERFVPEPLAEFAYEDTPLPIEAGQTISQPYIVALMLEAAEIQPEDRVLEIGVGSGYAAAVMSRIARRVHAIDRHEELTNLARSRMADLGYDNVVIRSGDGTQGWPENAPFDVILVAAGGPAVPEPLREQLALGGRLVIPVGDAGEQRLMRLTRIDEESFVEDDLGAVRFVPLVGAHGWTNAGRTATHGGGSEDERTVKVVAAHAEALPGIDHPDFAKFVDRFAGARIVLLGEASHGTSEFYRARAAITRRLVEGHGFTIVAVEADWPDAAAIDRHVRGRPTRAPEPPFQRFPTWMWRNEEVAAFIGWLRDHNAKREPVAQTGFYGLDLYNLTASIEAVLSYLDRVDPEAAGIARERYACLAPYGSDPASYGRMAISEGYARCEAAVIDQLRDLFGNARDYAASDGDDFLDAAQNARLIANAEAYYRAMFYGAAESWNLRDKHMAETLELLLAAKGESAKAVVWAHNSHIGDARATDMGRIRGELNLGQLCREAHGDRARLIGFGTHDGTVAAATDWGGAMEINQVKPSLPGSYERLFHDTEIERFFLDLREGVHPDLRSALRAERLERFIGVIYRSDTERWSHYANAALAKQYDGWIWFDHTEAVQALPAHSAQGEKDLFPSGQ
ncbi:protein-L-isoaspartate(D-aspartate) O-methyltransferase [Sphingopyxis sp. PAMC25046]|uniref:protein-L-isoaspartate(D-aspartate) O-methyltransferase n=1 Tax=Sphingopyxis sp. PAMC25046 TaxID=2565556 RepID=UPI00109DBF3D|nr:protein-L-isoaspartate(D-aspartate) O-methyltransferase [Sphingopyxis sp. PAMC25046]QCB55713.1 protein-L-isoaspartate(D-aspartate) O-methyltransferase [Sphingopyxis sp. PAMC25046]